jgi:hypothetical protein
MKAYQNVWRSVVVIGAFLALTTAFACENWPIVGWENATSQRVTVYAYGDFEFDVQPHQTKNIVNPASHWRPEIKVVAEDGRVLLEDHITWEEVREMGYKIVITDPEHPPPSPTPTPSPGTTPTA